MKVFVSYTQSDRYYLDELGVELKRRGVVCLSDLDLGFGTPAWYRYVGQCIDECDAVIAVVSRHTLANFESDSQAERPQINEINACLRARKRIFVLLLQLKEAELPIGLDVLLGGRQRLPSISGAADADAIVSGLNGVSHHATAIERRSARTGRGFLLVGLVLGIAAASLFHSAADIGQVTDHLTSMLRPELNAHKDEKENVVTPNSPGVVQVNDPKSEAKQ